MAKSPSTINSPPTTKNWPKGEATHSHMEEKGNEGYGGHFNEEKDVTIGGPMGKSG